MLSPAIAALASRLRDPHDGHLQVLGRAPHDAAVANGDKIGHAQPEAALCYRYVAEVSQEIIGDSLVHRLHRTSCGHLPHRLAQDLHQCAACTHYWGRLIIEGTLHLMRPLQHSLMQSYVQQLRACQQRTKIAQKKMANTALTHM